MLTTAVCFNTQLARIGGVDAALKGKTPRKHRVVNTRVSAYFWEDVSTVSRTLDTQSRAKRGDILKSTRTSEPVRADSASELWQRAETARRTAKRVCSFAAMSANSYNFSHLSMSASCAAEWRKVEELETAAYEAESLERSVRGDDYDDDDSVWKLSR